MLLYQVKVKKEVEDLYFPPSQRSGIGFVWQKDEDHIWFEFIRTNDKGESYISSPSRYCWEDIHIDLVVDQPDISNKQSDYA